MKVFIVCALVVLAIGTRYGCGIPNTHGRNGIVGSLNTISRGSNNFIGGNQNTIKFGSHN